MQYKKYFQCLLFVQFLLIGTLVAQEPVDSTQTPFREGRWLTGMSGSINSSFTQKRGVEGPGDSSNGYSFDIFTGVFVKERWVIGGVFNMSRLTNEGSVSSTSESFFMGPFVKHYFSDAKAGSIFTRAAVGYARYLDESTNEINGLFFEEQANGGGIGGQLNLGYSYAIFDRITFDFDFGLTVFWLNGEREFLPDERIEKERLTFRDTGFNFSFNVLLDKFFF